MAFTALKPSSRIMRASPHQSDEQQMEAYDSLLQEVAEEEKEEEDIIPHRKLSLHSEGPLIKQVLTSKPLASLPSDPASPKNLPTFIAPQGLHSLQLPHKRECRKNAMGHPWFTRNDRSSRHLVPLGEDDDAFTQSFLVPSSDCCKDTDPRACSLLHYKPRKHHSDEPQHPKQKSSHHKSVCMTKSSIYGLTTLQHIPPVHAVAKVKKRHSSASAEDMIVRKEIATSMFCDVQPSSWEEEVRQAMAKNSLSQRQSEDAYKEGDRGYGLQTSISVNKEYGISSLPPTLIVKTPASHANIDAAISPEEPGQNLRHNETTAHEKRMWKGFTVVKSPSEERWEEAAQDEERQEIMRRRARSQSLRYDASLRAPELTGMGGSDAIFDGNAAYNADEWAVYTRSGYINVRPRRSDAEATARCCSSLLGRSLSMRDTRMGLVMECAACGSALNGGGGHLLCFCSCCASSRASKQAGMPASDKKKGGRGILSACRRLLGLSKKRATNAKI